MNSEALVGRGILESYPALAQRVSLGTISDGRSTISGLPHRFLLHQIDDEIATGSAVVLAMSDRKTLQPATIDVQVQPEITLVDIYAENPLQEFQFLSRMNHIGFQMVQ